MSNTVIYQIVEEDLHADFPISSPPHPTWPRTFYYSGILPVVFILVMAASSFSVAVLVLFLLLSGEGFTNYHQARLARKSECSDPRFFDPITLRIESEGMFIHQGASESMTRWQAFSNVFRAGDYIWFHARPRDSFGIPLRAFASDEEANRFLEQAKLYCAAAKQTEASNPS